MKSDSVKKYLLSFPESIEDYPFGPEVSVFKIQSKMFCLLGFSDWNGERVAKLNLKCDPDEALMLRDMYKAVIPGYHMNKKHWNTVVLDGSIPDSEIQRMIDRSFALVVKGLSKAIRSGLEARHGKLI